MNSNIAWIELNTNEFSKSTERRDQALMYASVFDIPQDMRLQKDQKEIDLLIGYLSGDSEPLKNRTYKNVKFFIGASSGRIYKIEIDTRKDTPKNEKSIFVNLRKALTELKDSYKGKISKNNFEYVSKIINENFENLDAQTSLAAANK